MFEPLIKWDSLAFSTGIDEIDRQHQQLIGYINTLAEAIKKKDTVDIIQTLFKQVYDYTIYHFEAEEAYFHTLNKNDCTLHKLQHKHFAEELERIRQLAIHLVSYDLLFFLTDWLINHIVAEDKKFMKKNA